MTEPTETLAALITGSLVGDYLVIAHKDGMVHIREFKDVPNYRPREIDHLIKLRGDGDALRLVQLAKLTFGDGTVITGVVDRIDAVAIGAACDHVESEDLRAWHDEQRGMCARCWMAREGKSIQSTPLRKAA